MCFEEKDWFLSRVDYCFSQVCMVSWHVSSVVETNTAMEGDTRQHSGLWCSDVRMKSITCYQRSKLELMLHCENTLDLDQKNNENR